MKKLTVLLTAALIDSIEDIGIDANNEPDSFIFFLSICEPHNSMTGLAKMSGSDFRQAQKRLNPKLARCQPRANLFWQKMVLNMITNSIIN